MQRLQNDPEGRKLEKKEKEEEEEVGLDRCHRREESRGDKGRFSTFLDFCLSRQSASKASNSSSFYFLYFFCNPSSCLV